MDVNQQVDTCDDAHKNNMDMDSTCKAESVKIPEVPTDLGINMTPDILSSPFLSREPELDQLSSSLSSQENTSHLIDVAITGSPRVGKTQLLLQFIKNNKHKYRDIIWLTAESNEKLELQLIEVAKLTKIIEKPSSKTDIQFLMLKLYKKFNQTKTLIIFDAVLIDISSYLPTMGVNRNNIVIMITSPFHEWQCNTHIPLKGVTSNCAEEFLIQNIENCSIENAKVIAQKCDYMPSVLKLITSLHKCHSSEDFDIEKLLAVVNTCSIDTQSDVTGEVNQLIDSCTNIISSITRLHGGIRGRLALKLLKFMSYLVHDKITVDLFTKMKGIDNTYDVPDAMLLLQSYCLISVNGKSITISPIIQETVKYIYKEENVVKELLQCFSCHVTYTSRGSIPMMEYMFRPHIMKIYNNYATLELKREFHMIFLSGSAMGDKKELVISCTKVYRVLESILGDSATLTFHCYCVDVCCNADAHETVISITDDIITKYGIKDLESNFHGAFILYLRAKSLYKLNINLEDAWELCLGAFDHIRNVRLGRGAFDALQLLGEIACKLKEQEDKFNTFADIIYYVYTDLFEWRTLHILDMIMNELEPISIVIQHYIKSNQSQKALEFITKLKNELKEKLVNALNENCENNSDIVYKFLQFKHSECLFALNDLDQAWEMLHGVFEDDRTYLLRHKHEMLLLYCKLALHVGTSKAINSCYRQLLDDYLSDLFFVNIDGAVECFVTLEPKFCAEGKYSKILKLYTKIENGVVKDSLHEGGRLQLYQCKIKIYKAVSICKYVTDNNAWEIYENVCKIMKYPLEIEPTCNEDKLIILQNLLQKLNIDLEEYDKIHY